jgi:hypothetical protein
MDGRIPHPGRNGTGSLRSAIRPQARRSIRRVSDRAVRVNIHQAAWQTGRRLGCEHLSHWHVSLS